MRERITKAADAYAAEREEIITPDQMRQVEKSFLLQMIDVQWREHLMHLDHLRNVIGLRGYGQRDPLNEFKTEAFSLFEKLLVDLRQNVTRWLMTVEFTFEEPPAPPSQPTFEVHLDPMTGENELEGGFIPDGVHLPPAVLRNFFRAKPPGRVLFTTDAMAGAGAPAGRYTIGPHEIDVGPDRIARQPGAQNFAGSTLTPDEGVRNVAAWLGLAPADARAFWSTAPAAAFGVTLPSFA